MTKWAYDPVQRLDMLGWRLTTPNCKEEPLWWLSRVLEYHRSRGIGEEERHD